VIAGITLRSYDEKPEVDARQTEPLDSSALLSFWKKEEFLTKMLSIN